MLIVRSDIAAPASITVVVKAGYLAVDLTTVTGVSGLLCRRDGTSGTYDFAIVSATPSELIAQYTFAGAGEITSTGIYYWALSLAVPGGAFPVQSVAMVVVSPGQAAGRYEQDAWVIATAAIGGTPAGGYYSSRQVSTHAAPLTLTAAMGPNVHVSVDPSGGGAIVAFPAAPMQNSRVTIKAGLATSSENAITLSGPLVNSYDFEDPDSKGTYVSEVSIVAASTCLVYSWDGVAYELESVY